MSLAVDSAADEMQDSILWAHILLMMLTFGIIFPTGMVLGVSSSSQQYRERNLIARPDNSKSMACTDSSLWDSRCCCCILFRTYAWRESLCTECPRFLLEYPNDYACRPSRLRYLPKVPHHEGVSWEDSEGCGTRTWNCWKGNACGCLGTDAIWWNYSIGILPW